ncbi:MAG: Fic family protein [Saprospiraceae bacterium]
MSNKLVQKYPHILFKKLWKLSENALMLLGQCEAYIQSIINTPISPGHYSKLMTVALLKGAQSTTAIEGNTLTEEEIKKIMQHEKLPPSKEYQEIEVKNILNAFNEILNEIVRDGKEQYITSDLLLRMHKMVGQNLGDHFEAIPGRLRNSNVVVGTYRCPDYQDVPILLEELNTWLKKEFNYGDDGQPRLSNVIIQAIVSHIYIEWIHPFGDGNGRTGRLLEFYILLRGGSPDIASHILSNYYNLTRSAYYKQIEKATSNKDLSDFIEYALLGFRDGLVQTMQIIQKSQFLNTWHKLIYDKFDQIRQVTHAEVFKRQRTLALEFPFEKFLQINDIPDISIPLARMHATITERTIQRDLEKLIELNIIRKANEGYIANTDIIKGMIAKRKS